MGGNHAQVPQTFRIKAVRRSAHAVLPERLGYQDSNMARFLKPYVAGDDDFGANVITQTEADVWESLVLSWPECTHFRNQGWPPYPFFEKLDPAKPKGDNSYRLRIGVVGNDVVVPGTVSQAPDWDVDQLAQDMGQPDSQDQDDGNSSQLDLNASFTQASSSILSTPSTSAPKKRPAVLSTAETVSKKKVRINPQDALFSVSRSLNTFGQQMSTTTRELTDVHRTTNTNSSPERCAPALEVVHNEK
ncbi:hypothetical protein B0H13DRAFT_2301179 [Mycena leptocephala]|nr:hypothetical protein B0H13DRAFT_2301179 [Mycena leptocephala]